MKKLILVFVMLISVCAFAQTDTAQMKRFPNDRTTDSLMINEKPLLMDSVDQNMQTPKSNTDVDRSKTDVEQNYQKTEPKKMPASSQTPANTPATTPTPARTPAATPTPAGTGVQPVPHKDGVRDGVMMRNGRMIIISDGITKTMSQPTLMTNGNQVMMDGTVSRKDGTKTKLNEGDFMDHSGNVTYYREPASKSISTPPLKEPVKEPAKQPVKDNPKEKVNKKEMYLVPDSTLKKTQPK